MYLTAFAGSVLSILFVYYIPSTSGDFPAFEDLIASVTSVLLILGMLFLFRFLSDMRSRICCSWDSVPVVLSIANKSDFSYELRPHYILFLIVRIEVDFYIHTLVDKLLKFQVQVIDI